MTIWLDRASSGVLVLCQECPSWREHAAGTTDAWRKAADHGRKVHGTDSPTTRRAEKNSYR